jgi:hypothetical protein
MNPSDDPTPARPGVILKTLLILSKLRKGIFRQDLQDEQDFSLIVSGGRRC